MKVMFLGAGASVDAGYPLTIDLLTNMEAEYRSSFVVNDRDDWRIFDEFRKTSNEISKEILYSSNPEVVLSHIDLLEATLNEADSLWWQQLKQALSANNVDRAEELQKHWESPVRNYLSKGIRAKLAILRLLDRFFSHRHYMDVEESSREKREYLHRAFDLLGDGDTVISTNWDTLSERVLIEQGKWNPGDGYGFEVPIVCHRGRRNQEEIEARSIVKLLKLHGSIGWHRTSEGITYFRHPQYLQYLDLDGCIGALHDRNAPPPGHGPDLNQILIYPTYLKQLDDSLILRIWSQASYALLNADKVVIVGYSLPKADIAIRALLIPLRERLGDDSLEVTVVNPNESALSEWQEFLGKSAILKQAGAAMLLVA